MKPRHVCKALLGALIASFIVAPRPATAGEDLMALEAKVRAAHPNVRHMTLTEYDALVARGAPVLLIDAREKEEFAVSHLPGAQHVAPDTKAETFMSRFGATLAGRQVIVYCSVGVRSSRLAERLATAARAAGAVDVANLEGGIFRWHNEGRPLARADATTGEVHPYDRRWGRYVDDQSGVAYTPGGSAAAHRQDQR